MLSCYYDGMVGWLMGLADVLQQRGDVMIGMQVELRQVCCELAMAGSALWKEVSVEVEKGVCVFGRWSSCMKK